MGYLLFYRPALAFGLFGLNFVLFLRCFVGFSKRLHSVQTPLEGLDFNIRVLLDAAYFWFEDLRFLFKIYGLLLQSSNAVLIILNKPRQRLRNLQKGTTRNCSLFFQFRLFSLGTNTDTFGYDGLVEIVLSCQGFVKLVHQWIALKSADCSFKRLFMLAAAFL